MSPPLSKDLAALNRFHCRGQCRHSDTPCACHSPLLLLQQNFVTKSKVAFVGGGLSSIEGAKIAMEERGESPIILELASCLGGIWQNSANNESRIQVDPVSFRPIDDKSPIETSDSNNPFDSIYPDRCQVLSRMGKDVTNYQLRQKSIFNILVLSFEVLTNKLVRVKMRCEFGKGGTQGCECCERVEREMRGREFFADFKELHIRTGSLTSWQHRATHKFHGQDSFGGRVVAGIGNDISITEFEGKDVVIVGMGAFSVENVRRALQGKANSITVLSRKFDKLLFPEIVTYYLRSTLQEEDAEEDENLIKMWRQVYKLVETGARATNLTKALLNPSCIRAVGGEKHFIFAKGLPSVASNTFMLGHKYGLVDVFEDEVLKMMPGENVIETKRGKILSADILIKCMGFETDEGLLKNHTVSDSYFIDGYSHVTHNLRADRVNGEGLIGPKVRASNFLISYYEDAQEYERCIGRLIECPRAFEELQTMDPAKNVGLISNVDYFTTLVLSEKLANNSDVVLQSILEENRTRRKAMYEKFLPLHKFIDHDKEMWGKLCSHFSDVTGKPMVPYPFEFMLEEQ